MTAKLINGVVKDFQGGDRPRGSAGSNRVIWDKAGNSTCGVVKISGEGITISLLEYHSQKGSIYPKAKQRVLLNEIEPLDIGSDDQRNTKNSRGFTVGDHVRDGCSFGTIRSQNPEDVTISWDIGNCDHSPYSIDLLQKSS